MEAPTIQSQKIENLREQLLAQSFAVPKLQRNFVWDGNRAAKLLDSIYQGMPIGSLFLWEIDRGAATLIRQSTDVLPPFNSKNKKIWFVIDGQQRLSVIHQAFEGEVKSNDKGGSIDFSRLCFAINAKSSGQGARNIVYRKPLDQQFVSISDVLDPSWKKRIKHMPKASLTRIEGCRNRLLKYPVPVVTVKSATLEEIGEVFVRVNAQGMRVSTSDRAIALMGKLDVRAMADELRYKVQKSGFLLPGIEPILMGFSLVSEKLEAEGDPPKIDAMAARWSRAINEDKAKKKEFQTLWNKFVKAFELSVDFMRARFPIHNSTYLPSVNMLATLAVFFFHHPGQPDAFKGKQIRSWFWATGVAQRYSGRGYHRNIASDALYFRAIASGKKKPFRFENLLDPVADFQNEQYGSNSARSRAFFCLLAAQSPRYLENGESIGLASGAISHSNATHRHHIFPRAQLQRHKLSARAYNSLCNICFLVSRDNQKIGQKLPRVYLSHYKTFGSNQLKRSLKSHLLPTNSDSSLWGAAVKQAYRNFRSERLKLICSAFEDQAGIKLFSRG